MMNVNKYILIVATLLFCFNSLSQKASERLKNEQNRLENQIASTKILLNASQKDAKLSLNQLNLVNKQIKSRQRLINNYDEQIRTAEINIDTKSKDITRLNNEVDKLKTQYKELLIYAYKNRSKYAKLLYILSSENIEEAEKRKVYLEKLAEIQTKQLQLIKQKQDQLEQEIVEIKIEKEKILKLVAKKKDERTEIVNEKRKQQEIYDKLKEKETEIAAQLKDQEEKKSRLQAQIQKAIQKEIAEEQARIEKARKEAERRRREEERKRKENEASAAEKDVVENTPAPFLNTKEAETLANNFTKNKGKLPWPVEKGTITENFGKNPHPTLVNVFTNNNGIDISTPKDAVMRCIFNGEVTSVLNIPGAGKVVIVKHGNYRTVYANLKEVYVKKGAKLTTKTPVGVLLPSRNKAVSTAHFEIHEVKDGRVNKLNPNLWITH